MEGTGRELSVPCLDALKQELFGDIGEVNPEACTEVVRLRPKLVALASGPEAKIQNDVDSKRQHCRRRFPQKRLDRRVPGVVHCEVGLIAVVANVVAEQLNVPLIDGQAERGMLRRQSAGEGGLAASWKS